MVCAVYVSRETLPEVARFIRDQGLYGVLYCAQRGDAVGVGARFGEVRAFYESDHYLVVEREGGRVSFSFLRPTAFEQRYAPTGDGRYTRKAETKSA